MLGQLRPPVVQQQLARPGGRRGGQHLQGGHVHAGRRVEGGRGEGDVVRRRLGQRRHPRRERHARGRPGRPQDATGRVRALRARRTATGPGRARGGGHVAILQRLDQLALAAPAQEQQHERVGVQQP
ncbi:hypothetical protein ACFMQL_34295 [Nonomuraea fastidiosa]|uniref:hypothetical protein n=1 Tax=Nonomuraea fastidiosa TaxID=46173 RepID=UPI00366ACDD5